MIIKLHYTETFNKRNRLKMLLPHQKGSQEGSQDGTCIQSYVEA